MLLHFDLALILTPYLDLDLDLDRDLPLEACPQAMAAGHASDGCHV